MSLDTREISQFAAIARRVVQLIDATTIAITDINPSAVNITRNQLAVLVNRYYAESANPNNSNFRVGTPPALAES